MKEQEEVDVALRRGEEAQRAEPERRGDVGRRGEIAGEERAEPRDQ